MKRLLRDLTEVRARRNFREFLSLNSEPTMSVLHTQTYKFILYLWPKKVQQKINESRIMLLEIFMSRFWYVDFLVWTILKNLQEIQKELFNFLELIWNWSRKSGEGLFQ